VRPPDGGVGGDDRLPRVQGGDAAFSWEIEAAVSEGATFLPGTAVIRFLLKDGRVAGFEALKVDRVDLDPDGRVVRGPSPAPDSRSRRTCRDGDRSRADLSFLPEESPGNQRIRDARFPLAISARGPKIPAYMCR